MEKIIHYCWFGDKPLPKLAKDCIKSWKKFLPDYKIMKWSEQNVDLEECPFIKGAYETKKWAFVADYVRVKALNEYGGIYFDTDMKVIKDISDLLEDQTFLGLEDSGYANASVWYEKEKNSYLTTELLKVYRKIEKFEPDKVTEFAIPKLLSKILDEHGLRKGIREKQILNGNISIYPRDYFYPYSFHRDDDIFTENTRMIHYFDASWLPRRQKLEMKMVRTFGKRGTDFIFDTYRKTKLIIVKLLKIPLFPIVIYRHRKKKMIFVTEQYLERLDNTIKSIRQNKDKDYIIFYNSTWFGVGSSTKELFENLVDCGEIFRKKDIKAIGNAILESNINQIIYSASVIGWAELTNYLKRKKKDIKVKVFWHGSHSQILDYYGWARNMEIIKLHRKGYIDAIGTCKKSLMEFYKSQGFNAYFITNKVTLLPNKDEINKPEKRDKKVIGIYAAKCDDWRKNMYSQMAAIKLIDNAVIDMVPLNEQAKSFAKQYGIEMTGLEKSIPREELMKRIATNDVNLYVTFSECAPMLPLESMELGVPCITGNNHHYFKNTELEKYVVVNNENDIEEIKDKIITCMENKDKIIELYKTFSKKNLEESKKEVKEFLES